MRFRGLAILILVLVLSVTVFGSPSATQPQSPARLGACSPPEGLQLPLGQGVEVSCRLHSEEQTSVEFLVNGTPEQIKFAGPGEIAALAWNPTHTGPHTLAIVVRSGGQEVAAIHRQVHVVSPDMPVRVP